MRKLISLTKGGSIVALMLVMMLSANKVNAQQELLTTQWAWNKLTVNPAYAGAKDMFSGRLLHRQQWVGLDGRPITTIVNAHSPLLNNRIALGITYAHDKLGVFNTHYLAASYAYRIPFKNKSTIGFGVNFGFEAFKINTTNLDALDTQDPYLQQDLKKINLKAGAGVYYYGEKFYVGVSTPNFIPNDLIKANDAETPATGNDISQQAIHLYLMGGYAFEIADKKLVIKPQMLFRTVASGKKKAPWQFDANLSFTLFERLVLGTTFRTTIGNENLVGLENIASADLMMGFYITRQIFTSYSYDFTLGSLKNFDTGSHEIMIGFDMDFKEVGVFNPRYF